MLGTVEILVNDSYNIVYSMVECDISRDSGSNLGPTLGSNSKGLEYMIQYGVIR